MNDRVAFASTMAALAVLPSPGRPITEATYEVYWRACGELTDAEFQRGAEACLRRCKFFPAPAELIAYGRSEDLAVMAADAYAWIVTRARKGNLSDATLEALTAETWNEAAARGLRLIGGGRAIRGTWEYADEQWLRKTFMEEFEAEADRNRQALLPRPLDATPARVLEMVRQIGQGPKALPASTSTGGAA